jgi:multiple antibiotic resistance protein
MNALASTFFLIYAALFPVINPLGCAPLFLGLTQTSTPAERHTLARGVAINSFVLLLASLLIGSHVLVFFGISLPVLRIAGGLIVTTFGWKQLNAGEDADDAPTHNKRPADAFYPLTMPLTVGPGSISVAIALGSQRPKVSGLSHLALLGLAALAGVAAVCVTIYLSYRFADRVVALLGPSGTNVVVRLSAFILVCIGLQIAWSGLDDLTGIGR